MALKDIMELGTKSDGIFFLFLIVMTLVQVTPVKLNPWDSMLRWLGNKLNRTISDRVDVIERKLDDHIEESSEERIRKIRADILDFGNACMNHRPHTKEEFEFVIAECDQYERFIEGSNRKNGVAAATIREIRRLYEKGIRENSFLKEGGNEDEE